MGFSKGTADIEFEKWEDAERALNTFNSIYILLIFKILMLMDRLTTAEIIVSSPYTRALQTAASVSRAALTCNVRRGSISSLIDSKGLGDAPNKQKCICDHKCTAC